MAALARRFGAGRLPEIEAALQEARVRALEQERSVSDREAEGWLLRVAHNLMVDGLRREKRELPIEADHLGTADPPGPEIDDELRLMFLCCHPSLGRAAQIAVTLRVTFGFETRQIARAFLTDERTVAQRIVRAKQRLREVRAPFEIPEPDELASRLAAILDVLYQVFTEGYATSVGGAGIDDALCEESLRLVRLLTDNPAWTSPAAEALRALFAFNVARLPARRAASGGLLLLHEQDRGLWDGALLSEGFRCLEASARGESCSRFHLEAGIAAWHAKASSYATTEWEQIVELYDRLREASPSPIVDVNRALAVAMLRGAHAGIDELDAIPERELVAHYPYALATYAELHASLGHLDRARDFLDRALARQTAPAERELLLRKRAALG